MRVNSSDASAIVHVASVEKASRYKNASRADSPDPSPRVGNAKPVRPSYCRRKAASISFAAQPSWLRRLTRNSSEAPLPLAASIKPSSLPDLLVCSIAHPFYRTEPDRARTLDAPSLKGKFRLRCCPPSRAFWQAEATPLQSCPTWFTGGAYERRGAVDPAFMRASKRPVTINHSMRKSLMNDQNG